MYYCISLIISKILPLSLLFHYFDYSIISCIMSFQSKQATFINLFHVSFQIYCVIVFHLLFQRFFHYFYHSINSIIIIPIFHLLIPFNQIRQRSLNYFIYYSKFIVLLYVVCYFKDSSIISLIPLFPSFHYFVYYVLPIKSGIIH